MIPGAKGSGFRVEEAALPMSSLDPLTMREKATSVHRRSPAQGQAALFRTRVEKHAWRRGMPRRRSAPHGAGHTVQSSAVHHLDPRGRLHCPLNCNLNNPTPHTVNAEASEC